MSIFRGLFRDLRQIKRELMEILSLQNLVQKGFETMSETAKQVKALLVDIGNDVTEIDTDQQALLDKIIAAGDAPTAEEMADLVTTATALKARTAATASKVPAA